MSGLRFAFRTLFKTPLLTLVAIISLALGIGANTAIFSLFDQVLLRPLPVVDPGRLVNLGAPGPKSGSNSCGNEGPCSAVFNYPMYLDLAADTSVVSGVAAHRSFGVNLSFHGETVAADGVEVSGNYFPVLGLTPALGRLLAPEDSRTVGQSHVVVLGYEYWRSRFGQSPAVLNDTLIVNGQPLTIVGVAPRGFGSTTFGITAKVFVPITLRAEMEPPFKDFDNRRSYWVYAFARLKPGVSIDQARAGLNTKYHTIINTVEAPLQKGMSPATLEKFNAKVLSVTPGEQGQSSTADSSREPLTLLLWLTGLVLLIACANIANLLLARSTGRTGEMAVRLSIGASRWQLIKQLLVESCLLALLGGLAGLLVSRLTLAAIVGLLLPGSGVNDVIHVGVDARVLAFTAVLSLVTGLLFGLFPALHSTRPDLASTLKSVSGQPSGARSAKWFRFSLVTAQIALSLALLSAAGFFVKSLVNIGKVDLGMQTDRLIWFSISPQRNGYTTPRAKALYERIEDAVAALPGVTGVTGSVVSLIQGDQWGSSTAVEGFKPGPDTDTTSMFNAVSPGYFRTLGIPLIAGREFTRADTEGAPKVAIVNEAFLRKFQLSRDIVGKRMSSGPAQLDMEIVGLVQDAKYSDVKEPAPPMFVKPYRQESSVGALTFYVNTSRAPEATMAEIRPLVAKLDANLPVETLQSMPQSVRDNVVADRLITTLSAAFAGLATLLAGVGLYGVLAFTVAQRTREFGLRMALGADASNVRLLVLRQVGVMALIGGVIGIGAAIGLGFLAASQLYEIQRSDPTVLACSLGLILVVAFIAGFLPARRAAKLDPMKALRYE
jgi:predicted permease